jgi:hypothetical protein
MDYHRDRFQDFSLMIYKENKLIALLPANKVENKVYSHQGLTYGGLINTTDLKSEDAILIFKTILEFLNREAIVSLWIKELPYIFLHKPNSNPSAYLYFKLKAKLERMDMHSVLKIKDTAYSRSRVNGIKRGGKHNLIIEETDDFKSFWDIILLPNLNKKHAVKPVHSLEEITFLKSKFPNQIRQFNVYYKDEIVAGTTIFETEHVAHSQYISSNADKNSLGSLDFLHAHLLKNVFKNKLYFNFGTSNENLGQKINQGLLYWKEGFGARSITQSFYKIETKNYKLLDDIYL